MDTNQKFPILGSLLASHNMKGSLFNQLTKRESKHERYIKLTRGINILSFSTFGALHECERKFALNKVTAALRKDVPRIVYKESNEHFAYGRAIESGVHAVLLGKEDWQITKDMFLSWDLPLWDETSEKNKSFLNCLLAIHKFKYIYPNFFTGWEIAYFNGKPAIELSMYIDLGNGFFYMGHADVILWNAKENKYRVLEIKSTGATSVHEAMYKNSDQAVGYSIMLDSVAQDLESTGTFEVFYLVHCTMQNEWKLFPFTKMRSQRAGWINTLLLDIQRINVYKEVKFWPKRGNACYKYKRVCPHFQTCDLDTTGEFDMVSEEELKEHGFDFHFTIDQIIKTQKELV